jgi:hypothetical protein
MASSSFMLIHIVSQRDEIRNEANHDDMYYYISYMPALPAKGASHFSSPPANLPTYLPNVMNECPVSPPGRRRNPCIKTTKSHYL